MEQNEWQWLHKNVKSFLNKMERFVQAHERLAKAHMRQTELMEEDSEAADMLPSLFGGYPMEDPDKCLCDDCREKEEVEERNRLTEEEIDEMYDDAHVAPENEDK